MFWFDEKFEVVEFSNGVLSMVSRYSAVFIKDYILLTTLFGSFIMFGHNGRVFFFGFWTHNCVTSYALRVTSIMSQRS